MTWFALCSKKSTQTSSWIMLWNSLSLFPAKLTCFPVNTWLITAGKEQDFAINNDFVFLKPQSESWQCDLQTTDSTLKISLPLGLPLNWKAVWLFIIHRIYVCICPFKTITPWMDKLSLTLSQTNWELRWETTLSRHWHLAAGPVGTVGEGLISALHTEGVNAHWHD